MPATQIVAFIIGSIVVIVGAYFATYLVARGSQKVYRGRLIQVLDRFSLAKDKSLLLIAVYNKIYLVAFAAGSVTLLDNIDPEAVAALTAQANQPEETRKPAENFVALFLAQLRRYIPGRAVKAKLNNPFPLDAYLSAKTDNMSVPDSFSDMLKIRLEKEELYREENSK
ncbi:MAG: flagellar biosynthetic protein FliO [Firmicutes bacterium]|nr:flagellar biosynthetic protein FliO [Bacillota bacterium]